MHWKGLSRPGVAIPHPAAVVLAISLRSSHRPQCCITLALHSPNGMTYSALRSATIVTVSMRVVAWLS